MLISGSNQHYLPASLIGGFGVASKGRGLREATVAFRSIATGNVYLDKAENLAYRKDTYRLENPPDGVDPDSIDNLWEPIESELPGLINRLENRCLGTDDDERLFYYVATAVVRHPETFEAIARDHNLRNGFQIPVGDYLQIERVEALLNQLQLLPTWRWRVLHSTNDAPRLMITDRGWTCIGEDGWPSRGLFLPMSPRVAIFGYLDEDRLPLRRPPFEEHLYLCDSSIDWINSCAWTNEDPYVNLLIAHPDDRNRLAGLPHYCDVKMNSYGPYRHRRSNGFFD